MKIEYDTKQPIYLQIMQNIVTRILRGDFKPGDKLPSWVDAGLEYGVNHNTIARVYMEMGRLGLVETRRGEGTFITQDKSALLKCHESMKEELLNKFFAEMQLLGYSPDEIFQSFEAYFRAKIQEQLLNQESLL